MRRHQEVLMLPQKKPSDYLQRKIAVKEEIKSQRKDLKESIRMDQKQLKSRGKESDTEKSGDCKRNMSLGETTGQPFYQGRVKEHKEKIKEQERFTEKETSRIGDKRAEVNEKLDKRRN